MMDQQAQAQQGGGGGQGGPGQFLATLDQLLGQFAKMMAGGPIPNEVKQAAAALQGQFRQIVEAAMEGQGEGGEAAPQGGQQARPEPMRGQGTPMGQY